MTALRACVLGQGSIGRRHAGLLLDAGLSVRAFDPVAGPVGGAIACASEVEALAGADIAVVATPTSEHERHARLALEAGVPVLVEKPLALDASGAGRLERLASELGVPLGVAMNLRFHPGVETVRRLLPRAGTVWLASLWCGSWLPGWRPGADYRRVYSAQRKLGGGVLLDAVHELDYMCSLLGPAAAVSAELRHVSELELDVEDVALLRLELVSGALATVSLDYFDRSYHRGCRIVGADASVHWEWTRETVEVAGPAGALEQVSAAADAAPTYARELTAFIEAVRTGAPPPVPASEGRHVLQIVDAARASAAAGGVTVRLQPAEAF